MSCPAYLAQTQTAALNKPGIDAPGSSLHGPHARWRRSLVLLETQPAVTPSPGWVGEEGATLHDDRHYAMHIRVTRIGLAYRPVMLLGDKCCR